MDADKKVIVSTSTTTLDDLSEDCLATILAHLNKSKGRKAFTLVCKTWLFIEGVSRESITIRNVLPAPMPCLLSSITSRFPNLTSLLLYDCVEISNSDLFLLTVHCPLLRKLSLAGSVKITDDGLLHVANGCKHLEHLELEMCDISDKGLKYLGNRCHHLQLLDVSCCNVTDEGCAYIGTGFPKLQILRIRHSEGITDDGIFTLSLGCTSLKEVSIFRCTRISGEGFRRCFSLEKFEGTDRGQFTDAGFQTLLKTCSSTLQSLSFQVPVRGTFGIFSADRIGLYCANLKVLDLAFSSEVLDNFAVAKISTKCLNIEEWCLAGCNGVSLEGWEAIAMNCKKLRVLNVGLCEKFCTRSLLALANGCCNLRVVFARGCRMLSGWGVDQFLRARKNVKLVSYWS